MNQTDSGNTVSSKCERGIHPQTFIYNGKPENQNLDDCVTVNPKNGNRVTFKAISLPPLSKGCFCKAIK